MVNLCITVSMKREGKPTVYERIAGNVEALIREGCLKPGDRIPSLRAMGAKARASVSSVMEAYMLLENRGLIEARPQSGFYVRADCLPPLPLRPGEFPPNWPRGNTEELILPAFIRATSDPELVQLTEATPSPTLLPTRHLFRILGRICRAGDERTLLFEHPQGNPELRKQIAKRATFAGTPLNPEEVLITNGGMESWNLCLRTVARPGANVLVISPTHFGAFEVVENCGMRAWELPCHPEGGIDLEGLRKLLVKQSFAACLVMPLLAHPHGFPFSDANKLEALQLLQRHGVALIEDDVYGDLHFGSKRTTSFKALDRQGRVLHCASFSKTISPGFRVSWIAPGRFGAELLRQRFLGAISSGTLPQAVLADYLATGSYDRHLRLLRKKLAAQSADYIHAILDAFPDGTRVTPPSGGFVAWVRLPKPQAVALHLQALQRGIAVAPGPAFSNEGYYADFLRVSFAQPWNHKTRKAIQTLGTLLQSESMGRSSIKKNAVKTTTATARNQILVH